MSDHVTRLAQELATMTPLQLYVLQGLVMVCHLGLITEDQADWQEKIATVADKLRRDFESGAQ